MFGANEVIAPSLYKTEIGPLREIKRLNETRSKSVVRSETNSKFSALVVRRTNKQMYALFNFTMANMRDIKGSTVINSDMYESLNLRNSDRVEITHSWV